MGTFFLKIMSYLPLSPLPRSPLKMKDKTTTNKSELLLHPPRSSESSGQNGLALSFSLRQIGLTERENSTGRVSFSRATSGVTL